MKPITKKEYNVLNKRIENLAGIHRIILSLQEAVNDVQINYKILNNDYKVLRRKVFRLERK